MYALWKLVFIAVISAGSSSGSDPESIEDLNKEEARQRTFLSSLDVIEETKFQCHHKPSGYYADPRFDCKVFHYCHEDGTRVTIPCSADTEEHKICIFKDIAFNACEGSEIYLALPEDLQVKAPKETTDSAINSATDFKLPNVLPLPSSENNHSTTPLSLNLERTGKSNSLINSKDDLGSIFEVFNSVLREIQAENIKKSPVSPKEFKLSPSTFSRGSKFQASSIKTGDFSDALESKNVTNNVGTYLVEVYHKNNGKVSSENNPHYKKSKRLFFLPKLEKRTPAIYPRRKKRAVAEALNVRRPFAVIYAKLSDDSGATNSKPRKKAASQRRDIIEVPFAPARVPIDVPTVPIAIETRRKKKNKAKKSKISPQTIYAHEVLPRGKGQQETSEQQNVLIFASEQVPNIGLESIHDREVLDSPQRPQQNSEPHQIETQLSNNAETPQNSLQPSYQMLNQGINPLEIPNYPFQPPTTFLTNSAPSQFYFTSQDFQQPGNFPTFNFQDQFVLQPEQPQVLQSNSFQPPDAVQAQSIRHPEDQQLQSRPHENNSQQRVRQAQSSQLQSLGQPQVSNSQNPRQTENFPPQSARNPQLTSQIVRPQTIRQTENSPQNIRQTESIPHQTFRQPNVATQIFSQPEISPPVFQQPEIMLQSFRHPGGTHERLQPESRLPQMSLQPESILTQTIRLPENLQTQMIRQPENTPPQTPRHPDNIQPHTVRQQENIPPQTIRQPDAIQPQSIRQLQNIYLQNVPTFSMGQPESVVQTVRQPQSDEHKLLQNTNTQNVPSNERDKNENVRHQRPQQNVPSQRFPGFDSPFFQEFPNFGSLNFNGPYTQMDPHSFNLFSQPAVRFPEQLNTQQHTGNANRTPQLLSENLEKPQEQVISHLVLSERPRNSVQQQYGNSARHQTPQAHQPAINQPGANIIYHQQPNQNPNFIEAQRAKQERTKPASESGAPQNFPNVPESQGPSRNRGRQTSVTEIPARQPIRQRNKDQNSQDVQHQNPRRPQENTRLHERPRQESQQPSNYNRRPTGPSRPTSEIIYRPQHPSGNSASEIPNEIRPHLPSTPSNFRLQESPQSQNLRDNTRDTTYRQRQPTRQRNRQYFYDNNGQTQPQYSTHQYTPTTPVPSSPPRQRTRQPEQYRNREIYRQNPRQINEESTATEVGDTPVYDYRTSPSPHERSRTRASSARQQSSGLPVTSRYFVTSAPRFRPPEEVTNGRRPQHQPETYPERPRTRPQAQIERPPSEYVNAEPLKEEYPNAQRYYSHRPQNINVENDVNVISTAEDPNSRHQTTPSGTERRPGFRGTSYNRQRPNPEIERGFLPVSERPQRQYSYATRAPEIEYSYTTRVPERKYSRTPDIEHSYTSRAPERDYSYATRAPAREYSHTTRVPEREYSHTTRVQDRGYSYVTRTPEREYPYSTRAPEKDYSYSTQAPEREYSYSSRTPQREYSYSTRVPEREYREPINERTRERYQNYKEEIPTTRLATTPRPTKKQKPPPPRPTFPAFPTFPPPPRRFVTSPRPKTTENPEQEKELLKVSENEAEDYTTTQQSIRRQRPKVDAITEIPEPVHVTENYIQTDTPEVTTRRRTRKRRPRPRRPKTTTSYSDDIEDAIQVETITQATTNKEITTRSTLSNFNRWRQETVPQRKPASTTPSTTTAGSDTGEKTEEYGSRINLFGRPRTRKPSSFAPRSPTTTPASSFPNERKRVTKSPTIARTRKPLAKKIRKRPTTTTETPETTELIARSDENEELLHYHSDSNLQELESITQLSVENMETTTEAYNDAVEATTETFTESYQEDIHTDTKEKSEDFESTRSLRKKFQNRPRFLKFGKPRLRPTDSPLGLNAEGKTLR